MSYSLRSQEADLLTPLLCWFTQWVSIWNPLRGMLVWRWKGRRNTKEVRMKNGYRKNKGDASRETFPYESQGVFLDSLTDCPAYRAYLNYICWATWAIWATIKKYNSRNKGTQLLVVLQDEMHPDAHLKPVQEKCKCWTGKLIPERTDEH